jgi:6,7-dimethyl-8-ribityllumazine synthase
VRWGALLGLSTEMGERSSRTARREDLDASDIRIAIVVSRFNDGIGQRLLDGATRFLAEHGCADPTVIWVPGAFELPLTSLTLAESGQVDAIVALGAVIEGETAHFTHVATQSASGLMHVTLDTGVPVGFGVLTTYNRDQALARSGDDDNKGAEAAEAAVEMANVLRRVQDGDGGGQSELIQIGRME